MNGNLSQITTSNTPEVVFGWIIVAIVTAVSSSIGGAICSRFNKALMPIGAVFGGGIGFILGLAIRISLELG